MRRAFAHALRPLTAAVPCHSEAAGAESLGHRFLPPAPPLPGTPPAPCHSTALSFRSHRRGISRPPLSPARTLFVRVKCPHRLTPASPSPSPPSDERGGRHSLPEGVSCRAPQVPLPGASRLLSRPIFFYLTRHSERSEESLYNFLASTASQLHRSGIAPLPTHEILRSSFASALNDKSNLLPPGPPAPPRPRYNIAPTGAYRRFPSSIYHG